MAKHNQIGRWGEDVACEALVRKGYAIVERNWRMAHYEIDIIAMKDDFIVFVEVKTREDPDIDPLEALDERKIARIGASAQTYMTHFDTHRQARFDVFAINGSPSDYRVEHIEDAFWPRIKTYH